MNQEQDLKKTFGQNVKSRRESRGWSQELLAEKAQVSKNTISDIETGQKFARAKTLVRLAAVFETAAYELLKPEGILPDKPLDIIVKYQEEIKETVEKIGNFYIENLKE